MVCERWCVTKMACERWGVTKWCERWCVEDGVWQRCVRDGVWQRWCVKDGVWQSSVWKMVCERWCVTKCCVKDGMWQSGVKDGVSKMVCDKVVCERWCVTKMVGWAGRTGAGYRIKNKNPTQRCGEKTTFVATSLVACFRGPGMVARRTTTGLETEIFVSSQGFILLSAFEVVGDRAHSCIRVWQPLTVLTFSPDLEHFLLLRAQSSECFCVRSLQCFPNAAFAFAATQGFNFALPFQGPWHHTDAPRDRGLQAAAAPKRHGTDGRWARGAEASGSAEKNGGGPRGLPTSADYIMPDARDKYTDFIMTKFFQTRHCWVLHHGHFGCDTWGMMDSNQLPATSYCTYDTWLNINTSDWQGCKCCQTSISYCDIFLIDHIYIRKTVNSNIVNANKCQVFISGVRFCNFMP